MIVFGMFGVLFVFMVLLILFYVDVCFCFDLFVVYVCYW